MNSTRQLSGQSKTLLWAPEHEIEPAALAQIRAMGEHPGVIGVRIMPDVHVGKGAVVGSVFATRGQASPEAVGTDLGCGVLGIRTNLNMEQLGNLGMLRAEMERRIPVGFTSHASPVDMNKIPLLKGLTGPQEVSASRKLWAELDDLPLNAQTARRQFATLGGGNHFAEICAGQDGQVWAVLHSGSRGAGKMIAEHHIKQLERGNGRTLRMLEGDKLEDYLHDLDWAVRYARLSRAVMVAHMLKALEKSTHEKVQVLTNIECIHNYISREQVEEVDTLVTRKGAISAKAGEKGIIPASMGQGSYIVEGLGNPDSYCSASHGAGRKLSRAQTKDTYQISDLLEQTRGVECRKDRGVLDELPAAYKDIEQVMLNQVDLVRAVEKVETLVCVKG